MKAKIRLDKMSDVNKFVDVCNTLEGKIVLSDGVEYTVNARSVLGAIASLEWNELWVVSENDIYTAIMEWVI